MVSKISVYIRYDIDFVLIKLKNILSCHNITIIVYNILFCLMLKRFQLHIGDS